ncbi:hypothetical protein [Hymenobacter mucosus]|uniref:Uncharacterized protein n=1 Tax=Hymenobacter mucosus TaxID=1411120 RepID=A0A239ACR6_9BACT|nr:hypothetical protein [Hymenobacter mucosus]SNR92838.1 hypothetical protein SAMN06269173_111124 [Hymenobacter mucosus]
MKQLLYVLKRDRLEIREAWRLTDKRPLCLSLLYLAIILCLLLASCSTARRAARKEAKAARALPTTTVTKVVQPSGDTTTVRVTTPPKTGAGRVLAKVFGKKPAQVQTLGSTIILPRNNKKGAISINTGSGTATATMVGKVKAPTAIGDSAVAQDYTKQGQRGGAAASGRGATATNTQSKGISPWVFLIPAALYGVWYLLAGTLWGKLQVWLPARSRWKWVLGVLVVLVVGFLLLF